MPPGGSEKMNQPRPFPWRSVGSITPEQRMRIRGLLDQAAAFKKDVESVDAAEEASALLNSKGIINNEIWRDRCDPDNLLRIRTFFDGRPYAALVAMLKDSNPAAYEELTLLYMGAAVALETRHQAKLLGTTPLRPESPAGKAA
ncbi:MAG: hypothetical protein JO019_04665, partial [Candidatus Kaiserbacteria bacterium]|nr:hypothetical protein [Candidatus Kaiserbacteria bacterium]